MSNPPPRRRLLPASHAPLCLASWASGLALLTATTVLTWLYLAGAPAVPFGDESEHLADAWDLHRALQAASSLPAWLHVLAAPHTSYPNMLAALAQATTPLISGIEGVRAAAASLVIVHALVALWLGPRLWGWSATMIYIALCCCGPILLSLSTLALLDGPSAALTGITVLLLLSSEGFTRPGLSVAFGLAAAAALYTKWVLLVFLAPPVAWQIARAVLHSAPTRRARLALGLAMAAWAAALAAAVWQAGSHPALQGALRSASQPWSFLCGPALGLLFAGLVATLGPGPHRGTRALPPALLAATALLIITLLAGPWYAGAWPDLLARLDHETAMIQLRGLSPEFPFHRLFSDLGDLAPLQVLALLPGLLLAFRRPLRLGDALTLLFGGLLGAVMVTRALPPDLRYLLPAVPLIAASAATGLTDAPGWLHRPLAALIVLAQTGLATSHHAPLGLGVSTQMPQGASVQRRLPSPWPALPVGRLGLPDPLDQAGVKEMLRSLRQLGAGPGAPPVVVLQGNAQPIQGRAVRAVGLYNGVLIPTIDAFRERSDPAIAPDQLVVAAACSADPKPLARIPTRDPLCDLGIFRGVFPTRAQPPLPPPP